jgi:hypothetical protein
MLKLKIVLPVLITLTLFCVLFAPIADACGCCPPAAETRHIQNGRYVLVIITEDFDKTFWAQHPTSKEQLAIYNKYKTPGLYRNDGSTRPLWNIAFEVKHTTPFGYKLYAAPDGQYLASVSESQSRPPLSFYEEGKLIKNYSFDDLGVLENGKLIKTYKFPENEFRYVCSYAWIKEIKFYEAKGVLKIDHLDGRTLYFDIRTGEYAAPVAEEIDLGSVLINWSVVGFVLLLIVLFYVHRRNKKRTKNIN